LSPGGILYLSASPQPCQPLRPWERRQEKVGRKLNPRNELIKGRERGGEERDVDRINIKSLFPFLQYQVGTGNGGSLLENSSDAEEINSFTTIMLSTWFHGPPVPTLRLPPSPGNEG